MQVFRNYYQLRIEDPEFKEAYCENCSICPITIAIVHKINESSLSINEISRECGISARDINNLQTAENCCPDSVKTLCDYFHIEGPEKCLKVHGL